MLLSMTASKLICDHFGVADRGGSSHRLAVWKVPKG